jgi:hypothetical protein
MQGQDPQGVSSRRRKVIEEFQRRLTDLRGGAYHVSRQPINWSEFPFDQHPKAVAIIVDESTFLRRDNSATISLEFMEKMPDEYRAVDDASMDLMYEDAVQVFESVADCDNRDPDDSGLPLVYKLDRQSESAIEVSDTSLKVQGLVATASVQF